MDDLDEAYGKLAQWAASMMVTYQMETATLIGAGMAVKTKFEAMDEDHPDFELTGKELAVLVAVIKRRMDELKMMGEELEKLRVPLPDVDREKFDSLIMKAKDKAEKAFSASIDKQGRKETMDKIMKGIDLNKSLGDDETPVS